jgi:hypothetical protein
MLNSRTGRARFRALMLLTAAASLAGVSACDDAIGLNAGIGTLTDTFTVYALSGTPTAAPVALSTTDRIAVRIADNLAFDVAFDLDESGNVTAYPVRLVVPFRVIGGILQETHRVGIQKSATAFDQLSKAPTGGYKYDSATVVRAGETLIVEVQAAQCAFSFSPVLYTKIAIDSVFTTARAMRLRTVHDPNCGFRSFLPGIPKD